MRSKLSLLALLAAGAAAGAAAADMDMDKLPKMTKPIDPDMLDGLLIVRNKTKTLMEPLTDKVAGLRQKVKDAYDRVQTSPEVEIAAAAYQNTTVDAKVLAAELAVDAKRSKEAKLGPSPFCKALSKCVDPAAAVLAQSVQLLSAYLTVNVQNMGPNPIGAEVAAANGVPQAPINNNTANNYQMECTSKNITEYVTGHNRMEYPNITGLMVDVYTEWISVGLGNPDGTCQLDSNVGPTCSVVCARRGMTCNSCAMRAVTNYKSFSWAVTQAGLNSFVNICRPPAGFEMARGAGTGYFGYLCGTVNDRTDAQDDNFVLGSCNIPDYDKLADLNEAWSNACNVPTWRIGRDVFPGLDAVAAQGGALCYCEGASIVPPN